MNVHEWLGKDNELGVDIWEKKYQYNGEDFEQWLDRITGCDEAVKKLIREKKFLYGGRILANRNIPGKKTYSNCYVLEPPADNLESIFDTAKRLARTFSYGGGVGIDLGNLCPEGAKVNNTAKHSSGAVSFMELFNTTTGLIGQNGRRGALMLSMPVNHPDIEKFITIKSNLDKITNANISVRVTDEFMRAVQDDLDYELSFTRPENGETISKTIKAKELFDKLVEMNWNYAEPGMLFWDTISSHNLMEFDGDFEYAGTNPCAEEPLPAGGSCCLSALNLSEFVKHPFTGSAYFDEDEFVDAINIAVRAMNDVLDEGLPLHPLQEQRDCVRDWRQIGLGIMGLADCLIKLGLTYGSNAANGFCYNIAKLMFGCAVYASDIIGGEFGAYPKYNKDIINSCTMLREAGIETEHLRNSQLLTIAPTGSISTMLGISGGIEPIFANSYYRKTQSIHKKDVQYKVYTPIVREFMDKYGIENEEDLPNFFVTSGDIKPENRIACQAVWQRWIDASISSTINLPNEATVEDVANIYMNAWKSGLKGVTVYRSGCAREGVLTTGETNTKEELKRGDIAEVPDGLTYRKYVIQSGCGKLYLFVGVDKDGKIYDCFTNTDGVGGCTVNTQAVSRLLSACIRGGIPIEHVVKQLQKAGTCPAYQYAKGAGKKLSHGKSCASAIAHVLKEILLDRPPEHNYSPEKMVPNKAPVEKVEPEKCPECGESLRFEGGCCICPSCGWSRCS